MSPPAPDADAAGRRALVIAASSCAMLVLAAQLAGKAARDAIFLQRFPVTNLPLFLAVSSALAIVMTFVFARRLRRGIPVRVVRAANLASAIALLAEWLLLPHVGRPIATIIYMHQTLLGPILVSGFWSVVTECFDPRTARHVLGTVGTGATIGAVLGAVLAERVAAVVGTNALLPTIAVLQVLAMSRLSAIGRGCPLPAGEDGPLLREAVHNITRVSLLRRLTLVTIIVTVAAAFLDYLFKAGAQQVVHNPNNLARLFAMFHGFVGIATAVVQWVFGRWALQKLGLARTLATLPGSVIVFGVAAMIAPGIGTFVTLRGAENVVRNSLYREAYEVFYTPLLASERRATKTIIDVGVERFGDLLGGLAVLAVIALVAPSTASLLVGAVALSVLGMVLALRAQGSYVEALEHNLLAHAIHVDEEHGLAGASAAPPRWSRFRVRRSTDHQVSQRRLADLASGDPDRIRKAFGDGPLSPAAVAIAIPLLARPEVAEPATHAIMEVAGPCIGQLIDAIHDPGVPLASRIQLAPMIAQADSRPRAELAHAGLTEALADPELAIRCHAGEGLARLRERHPELVLDSQLVFDNIRRELTGGPVLPQALQHLSTLLALALPPEPIRTALHGLRSDDPTLRGVALEYLENVLPDDIRERLWVAFAIEVPSAARRRPLEDVLAELLAPRGSKEQIDLSVAGTGAR